jgi:TolB-like protein
LAPKLGDVISKALEKEPNQRYQSAAAMRMDLTDLLRETQLGITASESKAAAEPRPSLPDVPRSRNSARTPSIAVLPFVNMSSDKEQEYFSDGLAEELSNDLVRIQGLRVAARTSSFQFKGKNEDLRTVAEKLHVSNILEGSVRKEGKKVRITAQLINVSDGFHVWSEAYDRDLNDVFAVQQDIARAVSHSLKVKMLGGNPAAPSAETNQRG